MTENHRNWKPFVLIGLLVLGMALIKIAEYVSIPPVLIYIGLIFGGIGIIAMSIGDIRSGESRFYDAETSTSETYRGLGALMWSFLFILLGMGLIAAGIILLMDVGDAVVAFIKARPGSTMVITGLFMIVYGVPNILGSVEEHQSIGRFLASVPGRMFSVVLVLIGVLIIILGGWEIVAPAAFDSAVHQFVQRWLTLPG
jgi:hypothetical protein